MKVKMKEKVYYGFVQDQNNLWRISFHPSTSSILIESQFGIVPSEPVLIFSTDTFIFHNHFSFPPSLKYITDVHLFYIFTSSPVERASSTICQIFFFHKCCLSRLSTHVLNSLVLSSIFALLSGVLL